MGKSIDPFWFLPFARSARERILTGTDLGQKGLHRRERTPGIAVVDPVGDHLGVGVDDGQRRDGDEQGGREERGGKDPERAPATP